jgi:hypothetical protein
MSSSNAELISLDAYVDTLVTMNRPSYVEVSGWTKCDSIPRLIGKFAKPLLHASRRLRHADPSSRSLIFIDCGHVDTLVADWGDTTRLTLTPERVLLYIVREGEFLQLSGETYVKNITPNSGVPSEITVSYACFRDLEALVNSWEFCAGFYIWDSSAG